MWRARARTHRSGASCEASTALLAWQGLRGQSLLQKWVLVLEHGTGVASGEPQLMAADRLSLPVLNAGELRSPPNPREPLGFQRSDGTPGCLETLCPQGRSEAQACGWLVLLPFWLFITVR